MEKMSMSKIIETNILNDIISKQLKAGDKLPTEFEYMHIYNVSRITVSTALSKLSEQNIISRYPRRGSFVSEQAEQIINSNLKTSAPEQKFFEVPTFSANTPLNTIQTVSHPSKISIGFIIPSFRDLFALNMMNGLSSNFDNDSKFNIEMSFSYNQQSEEYIITDMMERHLDGIIIFPVDQEIYNEKILEMKLNKFPFVLIDRYLPGIDTHYVISNNVKGGELAASHLCDLGHTNILVCCGAESSTFSVKERVQGYKNELYRRKISINDDNIISNMLVKMSDGKEKKTIEDMLLDPERTGIITTNSAIALFLYGFFKEHGVKIPQDKSIVSYDSPINNLFDFNPFTFIDQKEYIIGREAGLIVKNLSLNKQAPYPFTQHVLNPELVINRTTAKAKHFK